MLNSNNKLIYNKKRNNIKQSNNNKKIRKLNIKSNKDFNSIISKNIIDDISGYLFIFPLLFFLVIFSLLPFIQAFNLSLKKYNFIIPAIFIGLDNYKELFMDSSFYQAIYNTIYYTFFTVSIQLVLSILLALILNENLKFSGLIRILYFIPVVTSMVIVAKIWKFLYEPDGLINIFLDYFNIDGPNWLLDPNWAMPSVIIMSVWKGFVYTAILFLAGLKAIPKQYYEAAMIDGANKIIMFFRITMPLLTPTTFFVTIILIISSFKAFAQFFVLTGGGPVGATTTLGVFIYKEAFDFMKFGYASATAVIFFIIIFISTLLQWQFNRKGKEGVL